MNEMLLIWRIQLNFVHLPASGYLIGRKQKVRVWTFKKETNTMTSACENKQAFSPWRKVSHFVFFLESGNSGSKTETKNNQEKKSEKKFWNSVKFASGEKMPKNANDKKYGDNFANNTKTMRPFSSAVKKGIGRDWSGLLWIIQWSGRAPPGVKHTSHMKTCKPGRLLNYSWRSPRFTFPIGSRFVPYSCRKGKNRLKKEGENSRGHSGQKERERKKERKKQSKRERERESTGEAEESALWPWRGQK